MKQLFRPCVAVIIAHKTEPMVWLGRREDENKLKLAAGEQAWQFPQGGIDEGETEEQALHRELNEETGIQQQDYTVISKATELVYYDFPSYLKRKFWGKNYTGQAQRWFLIVMNEERPTFNLTLHYEQEFTEWNWCKYWHPAHAIIDFKKEVYRQGLLQLWPAFTELYKTE